MPERVAPAQAQEAERAGLGQPRRHCPAQPGPLREILQRAKRSLAAGLLDPLGGGLGLLPGGPTLGVQRDQLLQARQLAFRRLELPGRRPARRQLAVELVAFGPGLLDLTLQQTGLTLAGYDLPGIGLVQEVLGDHGRGGRHQPEQGQRPSQVAQERRGGDVLPQLEDHQDGPDDEHAAQGQDDSHRQHLLVHQVLGLLLQLGVVPVHLLETLVELLPTPQLGD